MLPLYSNLIFLFLSYKNWLLMRFYFPLRAYSLSWVPFVVCSALIGPLRLWENSWIGWLLIDLMLPYLFCCSECLALAIGSSFSCVLLTYPHDCGGLFFFLEPSSLSGTTWFFRLILHISCPSARTICSSKKPWSLLLKNDIENKFGFHCLSFHCWVLRILCVF